MWLFFFNLLTCEFHLLIFERQARLAFLGDMVLTSDKLLFTCLRMCTFIYR